MKTTTLGIAIGTAIAALGLAITAVPEAKAGGVYWNNRLEGPEAALIDCVGKSRFARAMQA